MKKTLLRLMMLILPVSLAGQTATDTAAAGKEPAFALTSLGYTTNNNRSIPASAIKMPAALITAAFYTPFGLYVSADFYKYLAPTIRTRELEFTAGYEKSVGDWLSLDLSYTRRNFTGDSAYQGIDYRHAAGLSADWRLKNFTATIDNSLMVGATRNYFLDFALSYDFKADGFIFKTGYLVFSPTLTASLGTNWWLPGTIGRTWGRMGGNKPDYVPTGRRFSYQNLSLILPLQYALGSFTLSAAGFYSVPSKTLKRLGWTNQSGFLVSLSYSVIFQR
jgi:hypothetical protein